MPDTDIDSAIATDMTNVVEDYSVAPETTDAGEEENEFEWQMEHWEEWYGFYKKIPELKVAINTEATWVMGGGFKADPETELLLGTIKGHGKDSFNSILKNQIRTMSIGGDSFAEIIRDKTGFLINIKPLDPSSIVSIWNRKGIIKRYEQVTKIKGKKKILQTFKPEEMFHLSRERIADEVHGISAVESVKEIILMRNEAMTDWKTVMHRNVQPLWVIHLDTDNTTEIATLKTKWDNARKNGENMFVPKGVVVPELIATATNASLNPLSWIDKLTDYFFQAVNVPQIIIGNAKEFTDASGKIVYLSYEQGVKDKQLYVEEQVLGQLNIEINLVFPSSLQSDTISDTTSEVEEEPQEPAAQPNDTTEELEGKT